MAQKVTYADLRFVKVPPKTGQDQGPSAPDFIPPAVPPETSEEELTYENITPQTEEVKPPSSSEAPKELGAVMRYAPWALGGTCLLLLAATVGLGVSHWRLSEHFQWASQVHAENSSILAQRLFAKEGDLAGCWSLLAEEKAALSSTKTALQKSQAANNETQRQLAELGEELWHTDSQFALLQQEKQELERNSTSCQQIGCCPTGWKLFRWKCLWISAHETNWEPSKKFCASKKAQLLILKQPWSAQEIWDAKILPEGFYWIGIQKLSRNSIIWIDKSEVPKSISSGFSTAWGKNCGILISNGNLDMDTCYNDNQYICEMPASSKPLTSRRNTGVRV